MKRDADEEEAVVAAPAIAALPYPYAAGLNLAGLPANYAGLAGVPALNYAGVPAVNYAGVAGVPALNYAVAAPAVAAPVATVAAAPAPLAAAAPAIAAPVAYAGAPSREATLTTIKLNPGHATFYRVD